LNQQYFILEEWLGSHKFHTHLYKLADASNPGTWQWFVTSLALPFPIAYHVPERVGSYNYTISGLQRSPYGFSSNVSLSTLRDHRYLWSRKTRYVVVLVTPSTAGLSPARWMQLLVAPGIRALCSIISPTTGLQALFHQG
jgi:hypothetical protein